MRSAGAPSEKVVDLLSALQASVDQAKGHRAGNAYRSEKLRTRKAGAEEEPSKKELYDLANDPYELQNVASDPQHAARIIAMAARLRQLRPFWPIDSDPNGLDPDEED